MTGVEHRFEQLEHLRAAVDDDHLLRERRRGLSAERVSGGRYVGHHRWSVSTDTRHQFRIRATSSRRIWRHFALDAASSYHPFLLLTPMDSIAGIRVNPL